MFKPTISAKYRRTLSGVMVFGAVFSAFAADSEQPYIYDYYQSADPAEYLRTYTGTPYKSISIEGSLSKIEAEDFDNGEENVVWSFKNDKGSNEYRNDVTKVAINKNGNGFVIGNVSTGDWLCYTIDVKTAGEYRLTASVSSDVARSLHFEVDGNVVGQILNFQGQGWGSYLSVPATGIQLSEGKHVIRWIPDGSLNFDWMTLEKTGEYDQTASSEIHFDYPRTSTYTHNPLFTDLTSPMFGTGFTGTLYTADPSAHVWKVNGKDVLYLYASHDMEPASGCDRMDRYHVFSTEDLKTWTDHGEIMNATTSNTYTGTSGDGFMWAPDCAYNPKDGKYYFVYPHKINVVEGEESANIKDEQNPNSTQRWGHFLAVSENPAGPFKCIGYIKGIPSTIDPCIFVDDNGEAYIFTSGQGHGIWGAKLNPDNWLKLATEMKPMVGEDGTEKGGFDDCHEAPYMIKRNGIYYLCHSDNNSGNNRLRYSTAENPLGPFTPQGIFMYPHGHDTHHNSLVEFNGKWYSFYHTADYSAKGNLRTVCFDEVTFSEDGKINIVNTWGTSYDNVPEISNTAVTEIPVGSFNNGGNGRAYFKRDNSELRRNGNINLGNEEWVRYCINVKEAGRYGITIRARQTTSNSKIAVSTNGEWRSNSDGVKLPETGNTSDIQELDIYPINLPAGEQYLELRVKGGIMEIESIALGQGQVNIPGTIEAEDLDVTDYKFQQTDAVNHSYRDDVEVAIASGNGITRIGNTTAGDYFTYTFNCTEAGRYAVTAYASTGSGQGSYTLTFDPATDNQVEFTEVFDANIPEGKNNGWDSYVATTTNKVDLTEGIHKMRFTVVKGLNIDRFVFVRTGNLPTPIDPAKIKNEIPGSFLGGDMDDEEGSYYNKQFVAEGSTLKNDYKANPDVKVRINGNGVVGNTTAGDFFTYYFNADKDGDYNVTVWCEGNNGSNGRFSLTLDDEDAVEGTFTGEGWGNQVGTVCQLPNIESGNHKMVFTVLSGLNLAKFDFSREKTIEDAYYTLPDDKVIIAGMLDSDRGSYFHKNYQEGHNSYVPNKDVKVKIDGNGKIGDTSKGDFYTYTLNCTVEGDYEIQASVIGSANSEKEIKFTFHSATEQTTSAKFTGKGWGDDNTMDVKAEEKVHLEPGIYTMKVELPLNGGIDLKQFKLTTNNTTTGIEDPIVSSTQRLVKVYSIDGRYLRTATNGANALDGLEPGIYIVDNQKIVKH